MRLQTLELRIQTILETTKMAHKFLDETNIHDGMDRGKVIAARAQLTNSISLLQALLERDNND